MDDESNLEMNLENKFVEEQNRIYSESIIGGGMNDLFNEYKNSKNIFKIW